MYRKRGLILFKLKQQKPRQNEYFVKNKTLHMKKKKKKLYLVNNKKLYTESTSKKALNHFLGYFSIKVVKQDYKVNPLNVIMSLKLEIHIVIYFFARK